MVGNMTETRLACAIFPCFGPVEGFTVEEFRAVDEVVLHPVNLAPVHDRHKAAVILEWNREAGNGNFARRPLQMLLDLPVQRQVDRHVVSQLRDDCRQGSDDVCQAAGLGVGNAL